MNDGAKNIFPHTPESGEKVTKLFGYWLPEVASQALLVVLPIFLDAWFIASLKSAAIYGALGAAMRAIHFIVKFAESIPVASVALIGRHNGANQYEECGKRLSDSLWTTGIIGCSLFAIFFFGAEHIYKFLGVPDHMIPLGLNYLRVQAITIPFMFTFYAFMGFFKGVKNTRAPLYINIVAITLFIASDYVLIYGRWGIPPLWLTGSALATLIRYGVANVVSVLIILFSSQYSQHIKNKILHAINFDEIVRLIKLSIPVVIDKGVLALAVIWLGKMIAFGGETTLASSEVVRNLERWSLLAGLSFAQILGFIISNNLGEHKPEAARANMYKVLWISIFLTVATTITLAYNLNFFTKDIDPGNTLSSFIKPTAYLLALFLVLDVTQIIFASALRGAGDVKTVMWVRTVACLGFFLPASYIIHSMPVANPAVKFVTIYTLYYITTALMAVAFYLRIRGKSWLQQKI
jgi:putative MATE family efflux protein